MKPRGAPPARAAGRSCARRILAPALLWLCLVAPVGAAAPVKLGLVLPTSGPQAPLGADLADAVELARHDLEARGVVLRVVRRDDGGRPEVGLAALERLATSDGVAGVVCACSAGVTDAVAKAAERYRVPLVVATPAADEVTRLGLRWVFRTSATPRDHVQALLDAAIAAGRPRRLAVVGPDDEFGSSASRVAKAYAKEKGLVVVLQEAYAPAEIDHRTALRAARAARADLVLVLARGRGAARLLEQSRDVGLSPQAFLLVDPGPGSPAPEADGALAEGVFMSSSVAAGGGREAFDRRYRATFGRSPSEEAADAYTAASILAEEAANAGGDRERIRQSLEAGSWDGAAGPVRFATYQGYTHQDEHRIRVEQIQGGRRVAVWPHEGPSAKPVWPSAGTP